MSAGFHSPAWWLGIGSVPYVRPPMSVLVVAYGVLFAKAPTIGNAAQPFAVAPCVGVLAPRLARAALAGNDAARLARAATTGVAANG